MTQINRPSFFARFECIISVTKFLTILDPEQKLCIGFSALIPKLLDFYTYMYIKTILYIIMILQKGEKKSNWP